MYTKKPSTAALIGASLLTALLGGCGDASESQKHEKFIVRIFLIDRVTQLESQEEIEVDGGFEFRPAHNKMVVGISAVRVPNVEVIGGAHTSE